MSPWKPRVCQAPVPRRADVLKSITNRRRTPIAPADEVTMTSVSRLRVLQSVTLAALGVIVCVSSANEASAEETGPASAGAGCSNPTTFADPLSAPHWNGWGVDVSQRRFQPADMAQLGAQDVPRLKLKWAFGFPGANFAFAQPMVMGGRVLIGSSIGKVYLDKAIAATTPSARAASSSLARSAACSAASTGIAAPFRHRPHEYRRPPRSVRPQRHPGDSANVVLSAVGHNLRLVLAENSFAPNTRSAAPSPSRR
jgi:hypothetical protein